MHPCVPYVPSHVPCTVCYLAALSSHASIPKICSSGSSQRDCSTPQSAKLPATVAAANKEYIEAVKVQAKTLALDPANTEYKDHMARYRKAAGA